ncbi:MAG: flagellar hook-associated protein FlgL [Gammaproteobacteria bacterium]
MRISTNQMQQQGVNSMLEQQALLAKTQLQVSTGKRILTPADDPAAAAQVLNLMQEKEVTGQYQSNADAARGRLSLEEQALTGAGDVMQRLKELAIQANNSTLNNANRASIAAEARLRLDELLSLANTRDANNEYLFSGYQGTTQPFNRNAAGGFDYNGDEGQRYLQIGPTRQVAVGDSGTDVFRAIRNGNGIFSAQESPANIGSGVIDPGTVSGTFVPDSYTISFVQVLPTDPVTYTVTGAVSGAVAAGTYAAGSSIAFGGAKVQVKGSPANGDSFTVAPSANQDIFTTVQDFVQALETPVTNPASQAHFNNAMSRVLGDLDNGLTNILDVRAKIGARMNAIDAQKGINDGFTLQVQQTLSNLQDLDYAEAVSRLNLQMTGLQAAQQSFIKIQGLSLFNFLR